MSPAEQLRRLAWDFAECALELSPEAQRKLATELNEIANAIDQGPVCLVASPPSVNLTVHTTRWWGT